MLESRLEEEAVAILEAMHLAQRAAFYAVIACWLVFLVEFGFRKRASRPQEVKRNRNATLGMLLEGVGYFMVWLQPLQRKQFAPFAPASQVVEWSLAVLAVAVAVFSAWLVDAASRRLGKQWALAARLVVGHKLIQDGPYGFVRNPIYLGMFGMFLATGLVLTQWIPLLVASLLFIAGTYIRIQSEERLLREAFGSEFEDYARRVPALIPGIY